MFFIEFKVYDQSQQVIIKAINNEVDWCNSNLRPCLDELSNV